MRIHKISSKVDSFSKALTRRAWDIIHNGDMNITHWVEDEATTVPDELYTNFHDKRHTNLGHPMIERLIIKVEDDSERDETGIKAVIALPYEWERDKQGLIYVTVERGGPSYKYDDGIHPSEKQSMYMRLNNVFRHELEHAMQRSFFTFPRDINKMPREELRQFIVNYLNADSEMMARAMGGFLQAKSQRSPIRDIYRVELNRMIDNLKNNFNLENDFVVQLQGMIEGLIDKQVQYVESRTGESLHGVME